MSADEYGLVLGPPPPPCDLCEAKSTFVLGDQCRCEAHLTEEMKKQREKALAIYHGFKLMFT